HLRDHRGRASRDRARLGSRAAHLQPRGGGALTRQLDNDLVHRIPTATSEESLVTKHEMTAAKPQMTEAEAIEADDAKYVMRPWAPPAGERVIIAKAKGCVVTDVHGKEYLDLTAGYFVNNAGHCHPRIIEAATKQLGEVLQVSGKHGTPAAIRLAKKLI